MKIKKQPQRQVDDLALYTEVVGDWRNQPHGVVGVPRFDTLDLAKYLLVGLIGVIALAIAM